MKRRDVSWLQATWPRPLAADVALNLLTRIAAQPKSPVIALELRAEGRDIIALIGTSVENTKRLSNLVRELVPGTALSPFSGRSPVLVSRELRPSDSAPLLGADKPDPAIATAIHAALAVVREGEVLVVQVILQPGLRPIDHDQPSPSMWQSLIGATPKASTSTRNAIRAKHSQHGFSAVLRVGVAAPKEPRRASLGEGLIGALKTAERPGVRLRSKPARAADLDHGQAPRIWPMRLSAAEVVTLAGLPIEADTFPGLPAPHPRRLAAYVAVDGDLRLAGSNAPGSNGHSIGLSVDSLRTHLLMTGLTGTGKSSATIGLLTQLMERGHGLIAVEPKNDLSSELLSRVPAHRRDDVVILDPTDPEPVGLNPLARGTRTTPEQVADSVLAIFTGMFSRGGLGPRTTDILYASTLTLARYQGTTLTDIPRLLSDAAFRRAIVGAAVAADPYGLGSFWNWYESISDAERNSATAPLMNKLRPILMRQQVRNVLGQTHPRFDISQVFTENKILIVPLNKGLLGAESAHWIGALLVARIWETLLAQAALPSDQRPVVAVALDEFQDYTHLGTNLGEAMSQSRALGGAWILNSQFLDQAGPIKDDVLSHARSRMVFTPSTKDAEAVAKSTHGVLKPIDFTSLGQYELYLDLQRAGRSQGWASGRTEPLSAATSDQAELRSASRERYGAVPTEPSTAQPVPAPAAVTRTDSGDIGKKRRSP